MAKYSRTQKYEDLRSKLQNDVEADNKSTDISNIERILTHVNTNGYKPAEMSESIDHDPIHNRRVQYTEQEQMKPVKKEYESAYLRAGENSYTKAFNNEYLDEYIREVKQYNVENGNAFSQNTDYNILRSLKTERPQESVKTPYPEERRVVEASVVENAEIENSKAVKAVENDSAETADIPFFKAKNNFTNEYFDVEDEAPENPVIENKPMSKEDIAAEVQNLIRGAERPSEVKTADNRKTVASEYDIERNAHQQLLNETTQMRAALDDYEDNLSEVNERVSHTNQVLNAILIVLIIALLVVLGVVVYWVLLSKGIL